MVVLTLHARLVIVRRSDEALLANAGASLLVGPEVLRAYFAGEGRGVKVLVGFAVIERARCHDGGV